MADGYNLRTRPYPSDFPGLVTDWNPACACGHAQHVHDYTGDDVVTGWGACEMAGCPCYRFRDAEDED